MLNHRLLGEQRRHGDLIFAAIHVGIAPFVAVLAYLSSAGLISPGFCTPSAVPAAIAGSWQLALALSGTLAIGSLAVLKICPGSLWSRSYNAASAMGVCALIMHFGGGSGEAHFPFFIFVSFLLYYKDWRPIAIACAVISAHHVLFFSAQAAGVPVVVFSCLDRTTLLLHLAAGIGQCILLGYIADTMCRDEVARTASEDALQSSEKRFRNLFDSSPDPAWIIEGNRFTDCNAAALATLGYRHKSELLFCHPSALSPTLQPDGEASFVKAERLMQATRDTGLQRFEWLHKRANGSVFPAEVTLSAIRLQGRDAIYCTWRDTTERKAHEAQLRLAASVYHNTIEGILITDSQGTILSVNPAFTDITGYTSEEAVGQNPRMFKSDRHDSQFYSAVWSSLALTGQWQGEIWNRRKGGEVYLQCQTITRIPGSEGSPSRFVSVFSDITELRRKDERIKHLAFHDALTGLPNRSLLYDRLEHAIAVAQREGQRLAVLFLDLDRFKVVNDTMGHDHGDELLLAVADRLKTIVRTADTLSRQGGDEFVIVLMNPNDEVEVATIAERIIEVINQPMEVLGVSVQVGASVGIAFHPDDGSSAVSLMKNADTAMYAAKAAGKNTYRFFNTGMTDRAEERLRTEADLRLALDRGELELFYQPKMCLKQKRPCGAEALIRWRHRTRGLISPGQFIPLAEETGLIVSIGDWVLEESCRTIARWQRNGRRPPKVAVNISAIQFRAGQLAERLESLLAKYGLTSDCIEIELTESTVMADPQQAIYVLKELRALGVTIAVDDFGTGYSSLGYLKRLPIDTLKIDRSFVVDADHNSDDAEICRTIVALGNSLGLTVVGEGVETAGQAQFLARSGCPVAQGYHFAGPMPAAEFEEWLVRHTDGGARPPLTLAGGA